MVHLVALALWLGGMIFFLVVLGPAVRESEAPIAIKTLNRGRIGLEIISWTAIALLLASGTVNSMIRAQAEGAAPGGMYGFLLGAKLLLFAAMVIHHGLQVFKYAPRIAALTDNLPAGERAWPEPLLSNWRRWFLLLKINAALGPIAMFLGIAAAAS